MKPLSLLASLCFIGGVVWTLTRSEATVRAIQAKYYSIASVFLKPGAELEMKARSFVKEVRHSTELELELERVRKEVGRLQIIEHRFREVEVENSQLRHALNFQKTAKFDLVSAQVIRRQPATWWRTVDVNAGSDRKIAEQCAVMSNEGLIGKIDRLDQQRSSVLLLTDEKCQVSAFVEGSTEVGILSGQREQQASNPMLRLQFLSKDCTIRKGQKVFTTGRGGIFQPNVLLGTIEAVENVGLDSEALVRPAVNFSNLNTIFVVLSRDENTQK